MQASQNPFAIKPSVFPRREGEYTVAGWLDCDMDLLAEHFCVKPSLYTAPDRRSAFPWRHRTIFLKLPNASYATLTQHEYRKEQVEIGLRIHNRLIFDEADLVSLQSILPKDIGAIRKIDNGFAWVPVSQAALCGS